MYEIKNILNSSPSQSENAPSKAFIPQVYKKPRVHRVPFRVFAMRPLVFKGTEDELVYNVSRLRNIDKKLYWYLTRMTAEGKRIYPSHAYLANMFGCSREWICKCLKRLQFLGLIDIYRRNEKHCIDGELIIKNESNVYRVVADVMKRHVQERIMQYIPGFRFLFLAYLTVMPIIDAYPAWFFWANNGGWSSQKNRDARDQRDRYISKARTEFTQYNNGLFKNISSTTFDSNRKVQVEAPRPKKEIKVMQQATNPKKGSYVSYSANKNHVDHDKERINILKKQLENVRATNMVVQQRNEQLKKIEAEADTDRKAANEALAAENLRRLFGIRIR